MTGEGVAPRVQFQIMHGTEDRSTTGYPACNMFRALIARVNNGERDPRFGDWSLRPVLEDGTTYAEGWETITRNARGEYYGQTTTGAGIPPRIIKAGDVPKGCRFKSGENTYRVAYRAGERGRGQGVQALPIAGPRHESRMKTLESMTGYFFGPREDFGLITFSKNRNVEEA